MEEGFNNANNPFGVANGGTTDNIITPNKTDGLLLNLSDKFKQNGTDLSPDVDFFSNEKSNGKRPASDFEDDDFGPETDVDAIDALSPGLKDVNKTFADNFATSPNNNPNIDEGVFNPFMEHQEKAALEMEKNMRKRETTEEFDDDEDIVAREETPTPPADGVHDDSGLVENPGDSDSEDEWSFIKGNEANKENISPQPDKEVAHIPEEDDTMSQLNPNAAEFVPVSPTRSIPSPACRLLINDPIVSQSPRKANDVDLGKLPSPNDFENEVKSRPSDVAPCNNGVDENSEHNTPADLMENILNGKNIDEIPEFHPSSTPTKSLQNDKFHFGPHSAPFTPKSLDNTTNAVYGDETAKTLGTTFNESIAHDLLDKESDPMSMSFYADKGELNPFDLNKVQTLPDDIDEFLNVSNTFNDTISDLPEHNPAEEIKNNDLDKQKYDDEKELASPLEAELDELDFSKTPEPTNEDLLGQEFCNTDKKNEELVIAAEDTSEVSDLLATGPQNLPPDVELLATSPQNPSPDVELLATNPQNLPVDVELIPTGPQNPDLDVELENVVLPPEPRPVFDEESPICDKSDLSISEPKLICQPPVELYAGLEEAASPTCDNSAKPDLILIPQPAQQEQVESPVCDRPESASSVCDLSESKSPMPEEPMSAGSDDFTKPKFIEQAQHKFEELCKPLESPQEEVTTSVKDDLSEEHSKSPVIEDNFIQEDTAAVNVADFHNEPKSDVYNEPEFDVHNEPEPEIHKEPEPDVHNEPEPTVHKEPEPDVHNKPEPDVHNESEAYVHKEPESDVHNAPEPDVHNEPEPDVHEKLQLDGTADVNSNQGLIQAEPVAIQPTEPVLFELEPVPPQMCVYPLKQEKEVIPFDVKTENISPEFAEPAIVSPSEESKTEEPITPTLDELVGLQNVIKSLENPIKRPLSNLEKLKTETPLCARTELKFCGCDSYESKCPNLGPNLESATFPLTVEYNSEKNNASSSLGSKSYKTFFEDDVDLTESKNTIQSLQAPFIDLQKALSSSFKAIVPKMFPEQFKLQASIPPDTSTVPLASSEATTIKTDPQNTCICSPEQNPAPIIADIPPQIMDKYNLLKSKPDTSNKDNKMQELLAYTLAELYEDLRKHSVRDVSETLGFNSAEIENQKTQSFLCDQLKSSQEPEIVTASEDIKETESIDSPEILEDVKTNPKVESATNRVEFRSRIPEPIHILGEIYKDQPIPVLSTSEESLARDDIENKSSNIEFDEDGSNSLEFSEESECKSPISEECGILEHNEKDTKFSDSKQKLDETESKPLMCNIDIPVMVPIDSFKAIELPVCDYSFILPQQLDTIENTVMIEYDNDPEDNVAIPIGKFYAMTPTSEASTPDFFLDKDDVCVNPSQELIEDNIFSHDRDLSDFIIEGTTIKSEDPAVSLNVELRISSSTQELGEIDSEPIKRFELPVCDYSFSISLPQQLKKNNSTEQVTAENLDEEIIKTDNIKNQFQHTEKSDNKNYSTGANNLTASSTTFNLIVPSETNALDKCKYLPLKPDFQTTTNTLSEILKNYELLISDCAVTCVTSNNLISEHAPEFKHDFSKTYVSEPDSPAQDLSETEPENSLKTEYYSKKDEDQQRIFLPVCDYSFLLPITDYETENNDLVLEKLSLELLQQENYQPVYDYSYIYPSCAALELEYDTVSEHTINQQINLEAFELKTANSSFAQKMTVESTLIETTLNPSDSAHSSLKDEKAYDLVCDYSYVLPLSENKISSKSALVTVDSKTKTNDDNSVNDPLKMWFEINEDKKSMKLSCNQELLFPPSTTGDIKLGKCMLSDSKLSPQIDSTKANSKKEYSSNESLKFTSVSDVIELKTTESLLNLAELTKISTDISSPGKIKSNIEKNCTEKLSLKIVPDKVVDLKNKEPLLNIGSEDLDSAFDQSESDPTLEKVEIPEEAKEDQQTLNKQMVESKISESQEITKNISKTVIVETVADEVKEYFSNDQSNKHSFKEEIKLVNNSVDVNKQITSDRQNSKTQMILDTQDTLKTKLDSNNELRSSNDKPTAVANELNSKVISSNNKEHTLKDDLNYGTDVLNNDTTKSLLVITNFPKKDESKTETSLVAADPLVKPSLNRSENEYSKNVKIYSELELNVSKSKHQTMCLDSTSAPQLNSGNESISLIVCPQTVIERTENSNITPESEASNISLPNLESAELLASSSSDYHSLELPYHLTESTHTLSDIYNCYDSLYEFEIERLHQEFEEAHLYRIQSEEGFVDYQTINTEEFEPEIFKPEEVEQSQNTPVDDALKTTDFQICNNNFLLLEESNTKLELPPPQTDFSKFDLPPEFIPRAQLISETYVMSTTNLKSNYNNYKLNSEEIKLRDKLMNNNESQSNTNIIQIEQSKTKQPNSNEDTNIYPTGKTLKEQASSQHISDPEPYLIPQSIANTTQDGNSKLESTKVLNSDGSQSVTNLTKVESSVKDESKQQLNETTQPLDLKLESKKVTNTDTSKSITNPEPNMINPVKTNPTVKDKITVEDIQITKVHLYFSKSDEREQKPPKEPLTEKNIARELDAEMTAVGVVGAVAASAALTAVMTELTGKIEPEIIEEVKLAEEITPTEGHNKIEDEKKTPEPKKTPTEKKKPLSVSAKKPAVKSAPAKSPASEQKLSPLPKGSAVSAAAPKLTTKPATPKSAGKQTEPRTSAGKATGATKPALTSAITKVVAKVNPTQRKTGTDAAAGAAAVAAKPKSSASALNASSRVTSQPKVPAKTSSTVTSARVPLTKAPVATARPATAPKKTTTMLNKTGSATDRPASVNVSKTTATKVTSKPTTVSSTVPPKPKSATSVVPPKPKVPLTKKVPPTDKQVKENANKITASRTTVASKTMASAKPSSTSTIRKVETKVSSSRTTVTSKSATSATKSVTNVKKPAELVKTTAVNKTKTTKIEKPKQNGISTVVTEEITIVNNTNNVIENQFKDIQQQQQQLEPELIKDNSPVDNKVIETQLVHSTAD